MTILTQYNVSAQEGMQEKELFGAETVAGDFNNDGFDDLAIGVIQDSDGLAHYVGGVHILYGSANGLETLTDQFFSQDMLWSAPQAGDLFASEMAVGDFNGDNYDDLAVGEPGGDANVGVSNAGGVHIFLGSAAGLSLAQYQFLRQGDPPIPEFPEFDDGFGAAMAVGDFTGDGIDDLAVSAPNESADAGTGVWSGMVMILPGSESGWMGFSSYILHQDLPGMPGGDHKDQFGYSLQSGYFNDDAFIDLAVGVPNKYGHGTVNIFFNNGTELTTVGWQELYPMYLMSGMRFGYTMASGFFDIGPTEDLAISSPGARYQSKSGDLIAGAGLVHVVYTSNIGFIDYKEQIIHQESDGMPEELELSENFGGFQDYGTFWTQPEVVGFRTLAVGNIDNDMRDDLLIGNPTELTLNGQPGSEFYLMYGKNEGIDTWSNERWHEAVPGVRGETIDEYMDLFGLSLIAGDFDGDGCQDVAAGAPMNTVDGQQAGTVHVFYNDNGGIGLCTGLSGLKSEMWSQATLGIFPGQSQFSTDDLAMPQGNGHNLPSAITLSQNYPNPFNPTTDISFALPVEQHVSLVVFDLLGRKVATLANQVLSAGSHTVSWDAGNLPTGMYLYRFEAGSFVETRVMTLAK